MILDEYSELKWQAGIKKKYIDLGYEFTKMGDTFKVRVEDLSKGSHSIVHVLCDVCGIVDKYLSYKVYNKNIKSCGFYACSNKCATIKNDETNLKLYGTTNPNELDFIKEKTIKTNLEKYGTKFIS